MINKLRELRGQCAQQLEAAAARVQTFSAFLGLDGFVDNILHVVDKRQSVDKFSRVPTIAKLAKRLAAAAGKSTNLECVSHACKLGGNGPIMSNALAAFGLKVTYVGNLGFPNLHPVFEDFSQRAEVHSIAEPGLTDALEFEDGKIMVGKHQALKEVSWPNIQARWSRQAFAAKFATAHLVGFLNWTMLPYMSDIWRVLLAELCPTLDGGRRLMFFDLADPEKRTRADLCRALNLIGAFGRYFKVILGLNEKEAREVAKGLRLPLPGGGPEGLSKLGRQIFKRLRVDTLIIHPVSFALAVSERAVALTTGPVTSKPLITTGAGDHFNAGFCLGRLLELADIHCLLMAVTASGFYVRTKRSPTVAELIETLRDQSVDYSGRPVGG
jgi:hypothetical protein